MAHNSVLEEAVTRIAQLPDKHTAGHMDTNVVAANGGVVVTTSNVADDDDDEEGEDDENMDLEDDKDEEH